MFIFKTKEELQFFISGVKKPGDKIGFVPTMGALHAGHIELIRQAKAENELTVCSIFVNPTQFNDKKDFEKYPRVLENDILLLEAGECDVLFIPSTDEMYEGAPEITPELKGLDTRLEGEFRPGHFKGVVQIVYLLLEAVKPDLLYMGLKDFQQQAIIAQLIRSMKLPVRLVPVATIREPSGLAMSSRNRRLTDTQRQEAAVIYQVLLTAKEAILAGSPVDEVLSNGLKKLTLPGTRPEYLKFCKADDLTDLTEYDSAVPAVLLVAVWWGDVRLIDNILVQ